MRKLLLLPLALLIVTFTTMCDNNKEVPTEYCQELVKMAEEGNPEAQYNLGTAYLKGNGLDSIDVKEGIKWIQKSADQDYPKALGRIGETYKGGYFGYPQDFQKALEYFKKGVALNDADSQVGLGDMFLQGQGVKQDSNEALKLFSQAAEQDNEYAYSRLGLMYLNGWGVKQDYDEAKKWVMKGVEKGNDGAEYMLGIMYEEGLGVPQDEKKAFEYYKKGAEHNNAYAQLNLYFCYGGGKGVEPDIETAVKWLNEAVGNGNAEAFFIRGNFFMDGGKVQHAVLDYKDATTLGHTGAFEALNKLANKGNTRAMVALGDLYLDGKGVAQDSVASYKWYKKAADLYDSDALIALSKFRK